ncbi:hypothetical protein [Streptomyces bambusae]|nr:hypothetical protein [Streptomyces bambusae]
MDTVRAVVLDAVRDAVRAYRDPADGRPRLGAAAPGDVEGRRP